MPLPARSLIAVLLGIAILVPAPPARAQAGASGIAATTPQDLDRANALFEAGDLDRALPIYDRLVSEAPQDPIRRLALVRALMRKGDMTRARYHLLQLRGSDRLLPEERARLETILTRLEGGRSREGWLRFAIVPESNPGQRTDAETVNLWGFDVTLNPAARAAPATGVHLGFGGALLPRIGNGLRLRIGAGLDARLFERSALNDITLRGEFGVQGLSPRGAQWGLHLSAQGRQVGGALHGRALGLHGHWTQMLGQRSHLRLRADIERWSHPVQVTQDGTRVSLSAAWSHALRPDLLLRTSGFVTRANARAGFESGTGVGVSVGVTKAFQGGLMVGMDLHHSRHHRSAPDPLFGTLREDRRTMLTARVMHRSITVHGFAPALEVGLDRNRSTIPLHDYRNLRMSIGFTREF